MKSRFIFFSILTTVIALFFIELFSYFYLRNKGEHKNLVYHVSNSDLRLNDHFEIYDQIDPLLGWSISHENYLRNGYETEHNSILLQTVNRGCENLYRIYISGGSTTDLIFDKDNWPIFLIEKLNKSSHCVKIYIASVGGYNSGQELLKLIRDFTNIKPDLHLSYSGANEMEYPSYVSYYEQSLFSKITSSGYTKVLPNATYLLGKHVFSQDQQISIKQVDIYEASIFWESNMKSMRALAVQNGYEFIGILQPVLGFGSSLPETLDETEKYYHLIKDYQKFYPKAKIISEEHSFLFDFTDIFADINENVFKDDCHLKDSHYQKIVANKVYEIILQKLKENKTTQL